MQKNVLAINDIACTGRCSLTIEMPIICAAKLECTVLPTAILSTHVGFPNFTYMDFTDEMDKISNHFVEIGKKFDSILTGFLGSSEQVDHVINIVKKFKNENNILVVDPAMADNGKLYPSLPTDLPQAFLKLCKLSDVCMPNVTEACLMTGIKYQEHHDEKYIRSIINKLREEGVKNIILTGVNQVKGMVGAVCYDYNEDVVYYYDHKLIKGYFHGTGDIFASAFVSGITRGITMQDSMRLAVDTVINAIKKTMKHKDIDIMFGVTFEEALPSFTKELETILKKQNN